MTKRRCGDKMKCPFRDYSGFWFCSLTNNPCPETQLMGFDYLECSTYKEEINKNEVIDK